MKSLKKMMAVLCAVSMVIVSQNIYVSASVEKEEVETLLYSGYSRLLLNESYSNLAIAKEDTFIYNKGGERIALLPKDAAVDILDTLNSESKYEVVSGEIRGYIDTDQVFTGKIAELRAVAILDEKAQAESKPLQYEKKDVVVDAERAIVSFEVRLNGTLDKAKLIVAEPETKTDEAVEEEPIIDESQIKDETKVSARKIKYSESDLDLLAAIIYCESGNQSREGKLAVANVILNRVEDKRFPNTIKGVVYAPRQFSPANNGKLKRTIKNKAPKSCYAAAQAALEGENNVEGYLYFDGRIHQGGYKKIGAHYFWKTPW